MQNIEDLSDHELYLKFPFEAPSQNHLTKTRSFVVKSGLKHIAKTTQYKTDQAKEFKDNVFRELKSKKDGINVFLNKFDSKSMGIAVNYNWYINYNDFFLKRKNKKENRSISARKKDCANREKYTTDCIFEFMDLNDVYIIKNTQNDYPTMYDSYFEMTIYLISLNQIPYISSFLDR